MYKLYLDDIRNPTTTYPTTKNSEWIVVRSYEAFTSTITQLGLPFIISFDHDLADEHYPFNEPNGVIFNPKVIPYESYKEKTGMDAAKWLVEYCMDIDVNIPTCKVHSANTVGAENINSYLNSYQRSRMS